MIMRFKEFIKRTLQLRDLPELDEVYVTEDGINVTILREGKEYKGSFDRSLRVDNPTQGAGMRHAHVFGRKGNEIVAVNVDGSASHGTKGRIPEKDAEKLRSLGFMIPPDRIIEWTVLQNAPTVLLG
jgi:hypothetical protein